MPFEGITGERMRKALLATLILLGVFLAVQVIAGLIGMRYIGTGITATNTINVAGHGEMLAVPNIAAFTFSVVSDKATVADAQADATTKANAITEYLKAQSVDPKDIQTTDYSVTPQYEYQNAICPSPPLVIYNGTTPTSAGGVSGSVVYCPPGKQVLKGYEVRQTTSVKVRDTTKAGDLLTGVGTKGATEVSSLTFTFDDPTGVQGQARDKAIADAKQKAQTLATELGVTLVRVVSFSENGNTPQPMPMVYGMAAASSAKAVAPEISTGQNTVTDDVSITYEIR